MAALRARLETRKWARSILKRGSVARDTLYQRARSRRNRLPPGRPRRGPLSLPSPSSKVDALALIAEDGPRPSAWIPAPWVSATRWWRTSTLPCCPHLMSRGSRLRGRRARSAAASAAPRATRAGWRTVMTRTGACWRSGAGPGRFPASPRLHHRDRGCRFPGCGSRFTQGHHLRHWAQGGPTTLSNLALLCRRHHRAVHEEGYQVAREPDGGLRFQRPDGRSCPRCLRQPRCPLILSLCSRRSTTHRGFASTRERHVPAGSGSAWIWSGPSTSCIPWLSARRQLPSWCPAPPERRGGAIPFSDGPCRWGRISGGDEPTLSVEQLGRWDDRPRTSSFSR